MHDITWQITIGKFELKMLESCKVVRSVEKLSDTAEIILPGSCNNKALEIEKKIKRGDEVLVLFGYDGTLVNEFQGFVERISTDGGSISLHCEDAVYKFRKAVGDKQFKDADVKTILQYICSQVGGFSLSCDYSFQYDSFVVRNMTGYDVIKKIQEETKANVYVRDAVLHLHPQYKEITGSAKYSFQDNIEESELEYKNAEDRIVKVIVEGKGKDGKVIRETAGRDGGDQVSKKVDGVSIQSTLQNLAAEQLKIKSYSGYSGSFTGWLLPYCNAGYRVTISDSDYEFKNGDYYVTEVESSISNSGGKRKITVGRKI